MSIMVNITTHTQEQETSHTEVLLLALSRVLEQILEE
jgi:hypothetical protein